MMKLLTLYLVGFALTWWPQIAQHKYQDREMLAVAADIASTDASPREGLRLMNVAAIESGFDRKAVGKAGERGAFQVMPPARDYGAKEALRRMREQGMLGYVGCTRETPKCRALIEHRVDKADLYWLGFDVPKEAVVEEVAGNP